MESGTRKVSMRPFIRFNQVPQNQGSLSPLYQTSEESGVLRLAF